MCKGSDTTSKQTSSTSTYAPNQQAYDLYSNLLTQAQGVAGTPYTPYGGQMVAPINQQQQTGIAGINSAAGAWNPYFQQAAQSSLQGQGITPSDVAQWQNPYTQSVVNATQNQFNNQNAQAAQALKSNSIAKGALGNSRANSVAQANLANQQQLAQAPVIAGLNSQGYQQGVNTALQNAQLMQSGASNLAGIGTAGLNAGLQGANAQVGAGSLMQNTEQQQNNAAYQQWMQQQAYPMQMLNWLASIGTGVGSQMGGTTSGQSNSTTTGPAPNPFSQILGGATGVAGLLGQSGAFGAGGWLGSAMRSLPFMAMASGGGVPPEGVAGGVMPESPETLQQQQEQLVKGERPVQMFPGGVGELPVPEGFMRTEAGDDVFHYNPQEISAEQIHALAAEGRENELLGLGPYSKGDISNFVAQGENPLALVERSPEGVERRAAAGTPSTLPGQLQAMQGVASPDSSFGVEDPEAVLGRRATGVAGFALGGAPEEGGFGSSQGVSSTPWGGAQGWIAMPNIQAKAPSRPELIQDSAPDPKKQQSAEDAAKQYKGLGDLVKGVKDSLPSGSPLNILPGVANFTPSAVGDTYTPGFGGGYGGLYSHGGGVARASGGAVGSQVVPLTQRAHELASIARTIAEGLHAPAMGAPTAEGVAGRALGGGVDDEDNPMVGDRSLIEKFFPAPKEARYEPEPAFDMSGRQAEYAPEPAFNVNADVPLPRSRPAAAEGVSPPISYDSPTTDLPAPPPSAAPSYDMNRVAAAHRGIESSNRYDARGPVHPRTGDRAYGAYQVMGANVGPWTKEVLGKEMTPTEFLVSPEAQDKVYQAKMGQYIKETGGLPGALRKWLGPGSKDFTGTTQEEYAKRFQNAYEKGTGAAPVGVASNREDVPRATEFSAQSRGVAPAEESRGIDWSEKGKLWPALTAAGFGMMASRSPFAGVAIGEGALGGQRAYSDLQAAERAQRKADLEAQRLSQTLDLDRKRFDETGRHNRAMENKPSGLVAEYRDAVAAGYKGTILDYKKDAEARQAGRYGLTPQYLERVNPETGKKELVPYQLGSDGSVNILKFPEGHTPTSAIEKYDAGTHWEMRNKYTGEVVGQPIPKNAQELARQEAEGGVEGKDIATAKVALKTAGADAQATIKKLDELMTATGLSEVFGPIDQFRPNWTMSAAGRDALARFKQLEGNAFLTGFQLLRGGGAITEIEGQKATLAVARLERANNEKEAMQALLDFRQAVIEGYNKLRYRAGELKAPKFEPTTPPAASDAARRQGSPVNTTPSAAPKAAGKPSLEDFLAKAKPANPGKSDEELTKFYYSKYGGNT